MSGRKESAAAVRGRQEAEDRARAATPDRVMMAQIIAKAIHRARLCNPALPPSRVELMWAWDAAFALVEQRDEWEAYGDPLAEAIGSAPVLPVRRDTP